jgi:hypothetical protein
MTTWYGWPLSKIWADSRPVVGDPAGSRGTFGSTPMSTSAGSSNASVSRITGGPCRIADLRAVAAARARPHREAGGRPGRAHAGPGIAEQHLLPRDLAQRVVVDDDLHRQAGAQTRHEPVAAAAGQPEDHIDPQLGRPTSTSGAIFATSPPPGSGQDTLLPTRPEPRVPAAHTRKHCKGQCDHACVIARDSRTVTCTLKPLAVPCQHDAAARPQRPSSTSGFRTHETP